MAWASPIRRSSSRAPLIDSRSDPARSTTNSLPCRRGFRFLAEAGPEEDAELGAAPGSLPSTRSPMTSRAMIACDLDECSFRFVHPVALFLFPLAMSASASSAVSTACLSVLLPSRYTPWERDSRIEIFGPLEA